MFEFVLPTVWPPQANIQVYTGHLDGADFRVVACRNGTFYFSCHHKSGSCEFNSPELDLPNFANLKVAFAWGAGSPVVAINGLALTKNMVVNGERIKLPTKDRVATGLRDRVTIRVPGKARLEEERFLRSIIELQERVATPDRVNLLEASAILRRLLLDAQPLAHRVNRYYRCRLHFPCVPGESDSRSSEGIAYSYINLAPPFAKAGDIVNLSLDEFLSETALRSATSTFTVRDVIDVCANTKGGVHFDRPKSKEAIELAGVDEKYLPVHIEASLHALADLSWSVIHGLAPLVSEIENQDNEGS